MIVGKSVQLRVIEREEMHLVRHWRNSPEVYQHMANRDLIGPPQQERWFEEVIQQDRHVFLIVATLSENTPIGLTNLRDIDLRNRHAESGLYIASPEHRSNFFGLEAYYLMLDYGFSYLNLHKVYGHVLVENELGVKMNTAFGFQIEGTLRDEVYYDNRFHDYYRIGVLKEEFYAATLTKTFGKKRKG